jgi:shikimate dehydrogenase
MIRKACIIGHPVAHSRSPIIHTYWLNQLGIDGAYERADVAPGELPAFLQSLAERGYVGANVTVPHKEEAFRRAEVVHPSAERLRAANTLWLEDRRLHAANTDVVGFLANLDAQAPGWDAQLGEAVVLGAGGGSRAVVYGLLERGAEAVHVVNRGRARADELAAFFGPRVHAHGFESLRPLLGRARILVNATSLGMNGKPPLDVDLAGLAPGAVVADLVYVPLETPLLAEARARGHRAVDGLGMLLHQAVPGFQRWFGVRPEVTPALRDLIVADIESKT